jgi:hypothetical protein
MSFPNNGDLIPPWTWNLPLELVVWFIALFIVGGIWLWTRSGSDRKHLPDVLGRNIEDFAGIAQEANGPLPLFLFALYVVVALFTIGYLVVTLATNYNY